MSNGTSESKSTPLSGWKPKDNETQDKNMSDKYNVEAAEALANEALHLPISEAVPIYEQLLTTFPTAAKFWKQFVEAHMAVNNDEATRQVFSRCLLNCLQVPLWRCYIRFIKKVNVKREIDGQEETKKAFDFRLNYQLRYLPATYLVRTTISRSTSNISGSNNYKQGDRLSGKRKASERQEDDDTSTTQSQPLPRDCLQDSANAESSRNQFTGRWWICIIWWFCVIGSSFSGDLSATSG